MGWCCNPEILLEELWGQLGGPWGWHELPLVWVSAGVGCWSSGGSFKAHQIPSKPFLKKYYFFTFKISLFAVVVKENWFFFLCSWSLAYPNSTQCQAGYFRPLCKYLAVLCEGWFLEGGGRWMQREAYVTWWFWEKKNYTGIFSFVGGMLMS